MHQDYRTLYFKQNRLDVLNLRLKEIGCTRTFENYGANISEQYRGKADAILEEVGGMTVQEVLTETNELHLWDGIS